MLRRIFIATGSAISVFMIWFAVSTHRSSHAIAEESLRALALSLTDAIERIAVNDLTFHALANFKTHDLAYFALIDESGVYRFHSNPDLIDTPAPGGARLTGTRSEGRVTLGTGEESFLFNRVLHLGGSPYLLRVTLHTYRAQAVVRRAEVTITLLLSLVTLGWVLALALYRFVEREQELHREMARRENLVKLGELGATLAHEIRNPLAGIKGFAQMIAKKPEDPRNGTFAGRMVAEALRLEKLVDDLLLYAGEDSSSHSPIPLAEVMEHAASLVREQASQGSVRVEAVCPGEVEVLGSRDRIGQVLLNLAKNAVQAMPSGGVLRMEGRTVGDGVAVVVSDSGCGIAEEHLPRIFEPFFTTGARGTGLGLPLCRKIVEEHGGTLSVHSVPGNGTTVTVTLPRCQSAAGSGSP